LGELGLGEMGLGEMGGQDTNVNSCH